MSFEKHAMQLQTFYYIQSHESTKHIKVNMTYRFGVAVLVSMATIRLSFATFVLAMVWNRLSAVDAYDLMWTLMFAWCLAFYYVPSAFRHMDRLCMMLMRVLRFRQMDEQNKTCILVLGSINNKKLIKMKNMATKERYQINWNCRHTYGQKIRINAANGARCWHAPLIINSIIHFQCYSMAINFTRDSEQSPLSNWNFEFTFANQIE